MGIDSSLTEGIDEALLASIDPEILEEAEIYGLLRAREFMHFLTGGRLGESVVASYSENEDAVGDPLSLVRLRSFGSVLGLPRLPSSEDLNPEEDQHVSIFDKNPYGVIQREVVSPGLVKWIRRAHTGLLLPEGLRTVRYLAVRNNTLTNDTE